MKSVIVWLLVTSAPSAPVVYSPPLVSHAECTKLQSALIAHESRMYSRCVSVTAIID